MCLNGQMHTYVHRTWCQGPPVANKLICIGHACSKLKDTKEDDACRGKRKVNEVILIDLPLIPIPNQCRLVSEDLLGWKLWRFPSLTEEGKRNGSKCCQDFKSTFLSENQTKAFTRKRDKTAKCNITSDMWGESTSTVSPSKLAWSHTCRDYMTH